MSDFLSKLQALKFQTEENSWKELKRNGRVFFRLEKTEKGVALSVVDEKGILVDVDSRYYETEESQLLRSIEHIQRERQFRIIWEETDKSVNLCDHPYLCHQLVRCKNIVDGKMTPIVFHSDETFLQLRLKKEGVDFHPSVRVAACDGEETVVMLSECFAWAGNGIYQVRPIGGNYNYLSVFEEPFSEDMLERYLSVLHSYTEQIDVVAEDFSLSFSSGEVVPVPTIFFEKVDADKTLYLRVSKSVDGFQSDFIEKFGLNKVVVRISDNEFEVRRLQPLPLEAEIEALHKEILRYVPNRQSKKAVYVEGNEFILQEEIAGPFLLNALPSLIRRYQLVGAEKLKEYKVKAIAPRLNISLNAGIDYLEGNASVQLDNEQFTLQQLLSQYKEKKYIQLSDGNRAVIDAGYIRRLERIFKKVKKSDKDRVRVSFFDLSEIEALVNGPVEGEAFRHHREFYEGFNLLSERTLRVPRLKAKLRPYQKEGVKWVKYLYDNNMGGCLADDMGLGKTLQTISVLNLIYPKEKEPTLLVMPRSLLFNWQSEIARFAPELRVYTYYGNSRDMSEALKQQLVLTTYAIVRNDVEQFKEQQFHYVILDESQNIKNISAQITQSVLMLNARHRLALSGTPVENNLTELYSLFRFLNPAMFGTLDDFNARYANPIQRDNDKDAMQSLRRRIFPFMLRRLKRDVLKDLPDRTDKTLYVEMEDMQARFYEERRSYYKELIDRTIRIDGVQKSQFVMFQALSELRRIASVPESLTDGKIHSPKLGALVESLLETVANGHKAVVFFNFIAGLELLGEALEENGIDYVSMTGATRDRKMVVERFQGDSRCRVMLMTLKTGGVGLNLTAADTVYIFEPWWNKAAEEQAINRLHRFGQKAKVLCFSMITQNTIEEKIQLLQQQKAELFKELIGSDGASAKMLSEEDINFILS